MEVRQHLDLTELTKHKHGGEISLQCIESCVVLTSCLMVSS